MSPELPLPLVDAALRGAVLALLLLLAAQLARAYRPRKADGEGLWPGPPPGHRVPAGRRPRMPPAARAAWLLCLGLAVQVPGSSPWVESHLGCHWQAPFIAISVGNAVLFWLFTAALFDDAFRWRPWHVLAWLLAAAIGGAQCPAVVALEPGPGLHALRVALRAVTVLSLLAALWVTLRHWQADLVEERRRLRLWLVGAGIVYTAVQLAARLSTPIGQLTPGLALADIAVLGVVIGAWAVTALRLQTGGLLQDTGAWEPAVGVDPGAPERGSLPAARRGGPPAGGVAAGFDRLAVPTGPAPREAATAPPGARPAAADAADAALAAALRQAMEVDRAYRDDGLSVASLTARLAVPEYRLRRHINRQMGLRNFNAFVNGYRRPTRAVGWRTLCMAPYPC